MTFILLFRIGTQKQEPQNVPTETKPDTPPTPPQDENTPIPENPEKTERKPATLGKGILILILLAIFPLCVWLYIRNAQPSAYLDPQTAWEELEEGKEVTLERVSAALLHPSGEVRKKVFDKFTRKRSLAGLQKKFSNLKGGILLFDSYRNPMDGNKRIDAIIGHFVFNQQGSFVFSIYDQYLENLAPGVKYGGQITFQCYTKKVYVDSYNEIPPSSKIKEKRMRDFFKAHPFFKTWEVVWNEIYPPLQEQKFLKK